MITESGLRGWPVVIASGGTIAIAAGAFWLSFTALADLARRSGIATGQAWTWPLLVDGLIVVSTVAAVALDGRRTAWYPWSLLIAGAVVSVSANALHAVVAGDSSVPAGLAAVVAAVPPVTLLASTHLTTVLVRSATPNPPSAPLAVEAREPVEPGSRKLLSPRDVPVAIEAPDEDADGPSIPTAEPARHEPPRSKEIDPSPASGRAARARELHEAGLTNRAIARELGVHPSTVGRWQAREHLRDTAAGSAPEPGTEGETP